VRPTIDEQLTGATRLLRLAEADAEITPGVAELVRNARRLVDRVGGAWSSALPFLAEDNARTAALLGLDAPGTDGLEATARRNEELRAELTRRIRELPAGPQRTAIGAHLRSRVDADPT
jgi:hypothetical protein